jgi:YVTN family beta-propeller protein
MVFMRHLRTPLFLVRGAHVQFYTFAPVFDGSRCYVSNAGSDAVSVLDVASHKELTWVPVGAMPKRIISVVRP